MKQLGYLMIALLLLGGNEDAKNFQEGERFLNENQHAQALECFLKVSEAYQDRALLYEYMGICRVGLLDYDNAIIDLEKSLLYDSTRLTVYINLGDAYYKSGNYEKALQQFKHVKEEDPKYKTVNYNLGIIYWKEFNKPELALELLEQELEAATLDAKDAIENKASTYVLIGQIYLNLDSADRCLSAFDKAIELVNDEPFYFYLRGLALCSLGVPEDGLKDMNRALELNKEYWDVYFLRSFIFLELGDTLNACSDFTKVQNRIPSPLSKENLDQIKESCQ